MGILYRPGESWLHRAPAGASVLALLALAIGVLGVDDARLAVALACGAGLVLLSTGVGLRALARPLALVGLLALALGLVTAWDRGAAAGAVAVGRMLTVVLSAWAVTITCRASELRDVVVRALGPWRRLGVDPAVVGLTLALAIRCLPLLSRIVATAQEARRARGARGAASGVTSLAVPVVVRSVRLADAVGEGLIARGYDPAAERRNDRARRASRRRSYQAPPRPTSS